MKEALLVNSLSNRSPNTHQKAAHGMKSAGETVENNAIARPAVKTYNMFDRDMYFGKRFLGDSQLCGTAFKLRTEPCGHLP